MKVRTRFIASVIKTAQADTTRMPWTRGVIRDVNTAARHAPTLKRAARTA